MKINAQKMQAQNQVCLVCVCVLHCRHGNRARAEHGPMTKDKMFVVVLYRAEKRERITRDVHA
jgi:hypothetical protein